ncbi:MFS transporter [Streptomyces atroolivaceus]|uniref:MFS transporter n=1 Tax=Streptomyces atroolivaceus TaxID=66869 RepID=A0ABV9VFF1_STRAZ|nr:MFS transporter [Streptomyces atroolivaceus]
MSTVADDARAVPEVPPLRRNRDYLLLWSGSAVAIVGSTASTVAYPLLVLAVTGSASAAGLVGFVVLLPALLLQLPAGVLVDRWNRKRVMIWCDALRALGAATVVLALMAGELSLAHVMVVGFAEGSLTVLNGLASTAAVPNVVHPSQLSVALAGNEARGRAATMIGTPLGGILFGLGRVAPFVLETFAYLVSLVSLLCIRKDFQAARPGDAPRAEAGSHDGATAGSRRTRILRQAGRMVEGLVWLWRRPLLRTTALLVAGSNLLFRALFLVMIVLLAEEGAGPAAIGLLIGVAGACGMLGSLVAGWCGRRLRMNALVISANWVWALLMCVLAFGGGLWPAVIAYTAMWFVGPIWNVAVGSYQLAVTPDELRGRVLSASSLLANGALPLGALAGGLLLDGLGVRVAAAVLAGWMVLMALAATLARPVRRATMTVVVDPSAPLKVPSSPAPCTTPSQSSSPSEQSVPVAAADSR